MSFSPHTTIVGQPMSGRRSRKSYSRQARSAASKPGLLAPFISPSNITSGLIRLGWRHTRLITQWRSFGRRAVICIWATLLVASRPATFPAASTGRLATSIWETPAEESSISRSTISGWLIATSAATKPPIELPTSTAGARSSRSHISATTRP